MITEHNEPTLGLCCILSCFAYHLYMCFYTYIFEAAPAVRASWRADAVACLALPSLDFRSMHIPVTPSRLT